MRELRRAIEDSYVLVLSQVEVTDWRGACLATLSPREVYVIAGEGVTESKLRAIKSLREIAHEAGGEFSLAEAVAVVNGWKRVRVPRNMRELGFV